MPVLDCDAELMMMTMTMTTVMMMEQRDEVESGHLNTGTETWTHKKTLEVKFKLTHAVTCMQVHQLHT